ncbi:hypothetical protein BT96DRAFT_995844 [Gymnopus androsaceus JB14]|uniref:F-box domain-containing protein n=1 Tax=Gymnopus androsaceus JB14 TaxID=1447944 RepID=A0A6A4HHJ0_9AGAR|nr:hypothetical protein BT96DRAFT_995844 [Gymnopus androsaceus JB14]
MLGIGQFTEQMENVFEVCSDLRELLFRNFRESRFVRCEPAITAPVVERLSFSLSPGCLYNSLAIVFSSMICPSLTSLHMEGMDKYANPWPKDELNMFISSSSFRLTTLSIKFIPLLDTDLIDLLHRLPSLLDLTIDDSRVSDTSPITLCLLQRLHASRSSALVTKLQSISLTFSGSDFSDRDFVDMISSRWNPKAFTGGGDCSSNRDGETLACLRSVVMRFTNRDVDEEIYGPLKNLEAVGMRAVVSGQNS